MATMTVHGPPQPRLKPPVVMGSEDLMCPKAHGTHPWPVQEDLRWGCEPHVADEICNFNRRSAERKGYFLSTSLAKAAASAKVLCFYDSNSGKKLFQLPRTSRSIEAFLKESTHHGWPSFRDYEVNWKEVRLLPDGEVVSKAGTHLGHNIPDYTGNRYCINLVSISGRPVEEPSAASCIPFMKQRAPTRPIPPAPIEGNHFVLKHSRLKPPFPQGLSTIYFGTGCYWGAEKAFWRLPGVYSTAVGFCGGHEEAVNPSYVYVCTGESGHAEVVQVVWDPRLISLGDLLCQFWSCHDPTQGDAQGADKGSQYRSGVFCTTPEQGIAVRASLRAFDRVLQAGGYSPITTEVRDEPCPFYYAEDNHQQWLAKRAPYRQHCSAEPTGLAVPPFQDWDWAGEEAAGHSVMSAREKFKALLPQAFWSSFDWSVHAPDAQATLEASVLADSEAELALRRREQAALVVKVEADKKYVAVVRFCGRCGGYKRRAVELVGFLQRAVPVKVGMVEDPEITGNFDVKVRQTVSNPGQEEGTDSLDMVHSKRRGEGFVDSVEKVLKILHAIVSVHELARNTASSTGDLNDNLAAAAENFPGLKVRTAAATALLAAEAAKKDPPKPKTPPKPKKAAKKKSVSFDPGAKAMSVCDATPVEPTEFEDKALGNAACQPCHSNCTSWNFWCRGSDSTSVAIVEQKPGRL
eukprot:TRINITY_DN38284_c0_g1_i1.p1 TRINITY_DN38284_c0_g1~~TRINITY_DN38284_c0_g1_i1.p1  ORF type:complete len:690 (-),score=162.20 TRINITY_DN38284_c0_g1_i1:8-2077(-)